MRCLIIDDESLARQEMRHLLSVHPEVRTIDAASNIKEAVRLCQRCVPDIIFLDVQLRGESGFDFLAQAPQPLPPIVFVTAYDQYAIRAFEVNALDYLLKPVEPARLANTLARIHGDAAHVPPQTLLLPLGGAVRRVEWTLLDSIESEGNYTRLILGDGTSTLMLRPLKEWLEVMPCGFMQIHRSTIIRLAAIREIRAISESRREVILGNGKALLVSRRYWPSLKQALS